MDPVYTVQTHPQVFGVFKTEFQLGLLKNIAI